MNVKLKKWLKLVATFPMMLMLGNIGDFAATGDDSDDDANEGDEGEGADPDSDEGDEGQEDDANEGEEDESGEDDSEGDEQEKGKPEKKNAQDRIQQLANEKRELADKLKALEARIAANEAKVQQAQEEKPDFKVYPREQVNAWLKDINAKIEDAELEDDLITAEELREEKRKTLAEVKEQEAKKKAWEEKQATRKNQTSDAAKVREEFDRTAEFYRQEVKVDPSTWEKMGKWFEQAMQGNPLLLAEFNETFDRQGKVAAIRFAHQYTVKHMGADKKAVIEKKTTAKDKAAKLSAASAASGANEGWKKEYSSLLAQGTEDAYTRAMALKRKHGGK